MFDKSELSIIIPTKDRNEQLNQCVDYVVSACAHINHEIIIVNDSKTGIPVLSQNISNLTIINNPKSGAASARNLGASNSQSDLLLFLDDDMLIFRNNIFDILEFHENNINATLNLNWTYPPDLIRRIEATQFGRYLISSGFTTYQSLNKRNPHWGSTDNFELKYLTSQNLSMPRSLFEKFNGYNERFPHAGFEDLDLSERLKKGDVKIYLNPNSIMFHNETDRLDLIRWLDRKKRGSESRYTAVSLGYIHASIKYGRFKRILLFILSKVKVLIIILSNSIPNHKRYDRIYKKLVDVLLAVSIYEGYSKSVKEG